jgi:hypothetical protein
MLGMARAGILGASAGGSETELQAKLWGGAGGGAFYSYGPNATQQADGGSGGFMHVAFNAASGGTLVVQVGGGGEGGPQPGQTDGGWPDGGNGGPAGAGGGGSSVIKTSGGDVIAVAGGGGAGTHSAGAGGHGGYPAGTAGAASTHSGTAGAASPSNAGTASAGGAAPPNSPQGTAGGSFSGGPASGGATGGGGGGYYGGGAGGPFPAVPAGEAGAGGGSSYFNPAIPGVSLTSHGTGSSINNRYALGPGDAPNWATNYPRVAGGASDPNYTAGIAVGDQSGPQHSTGALYRAKGGDGQILISSDGGSSWTTFPAAPGAPQTYNVP